MPLVGLQELTRTGCFAARPVNVVAQHQQERFISHGFPGAVDCVTETFLTVWTAKGNMPAHLQQAAGIFLGLGVTVYCNSQ